METMSSMQQGIKSFLVSNATSSRKQISKSMQTEKDPRKYMGITVDESVLPEHCDGYFVGYAGHNSVLLVWDSGTNKVNERIMRTSTSFASASYF